MSALPRRLITLCSCPSRGKHGEEMASLCLSRAIVRRLPGRAPSRYLLNSRSPRPPSTATRSISHRLYTSYAKLTLAFRSVRLLDCKFPPSLSACIVLPLCISSALFQSQTVRRWKHSIATDSLQFQPWGGTKPPFR